MIEATIERLHLAHGCVHNHSKAPYQVEFKYHFRTVAEMAETIQKWQRGCWRYALIGHRKLTETECREYWADSERQDRLTQKVLSYSQD